jgi:hypothetical protein
MTVLAGLMVVAGCTQHPVTRATHRAPSGAGSTPTRSPSGTTRVAAPATYGGAVLDERGPCHVPLPAAWTAALAKGTLWRGVWDWAGTGTPTPEGTGVLYASHDGDRAHITLRGRDGRTVEDLGTVARTPTTQMPSSAATRDYIAFILTLANDESASRRWRLYLWDRATKKLSMIAKNPVDPHGEPLQGGWVEPVLTSKYLYWITASKTVPSGWGGSSLMQYTLATGRTRALYQGLTESFVPYRDIVLYTALIPNPPNVATDTGAGAPERVYAVEQDSGRPVDPPAGITAGEDAANTMVTDGDIVIWNAALGAVRAWRSSWGRSISLLPQDWPEAFKLGLGAPAHPRLYRHFLIWQPSETYVLDLQTDSFAQVTPKVSEFEVSGPILSVEDTSTPLEVSKRRHLEEQWDQHLMNLAELPHLRRC